MTGKVSRPERPKKPKKPFTGKYEPRTVCAMFSTEPMTPKEHLRNGLKEIESNRMFLGPLIDVGGKKVRVSELIDNDAWLEETSRILNVYVAAGWDKPEAHYKVDILIPIEAHTRDSRLQLYKNQISKYKQKMTMYERQLAKYKKSRGQAT